MEFLIDLFVACVQYTIIAVTIYVLTHGYAFFDECRRGRPDSKFPAKSLSAVQIYGMIAAAWLPLILFLGWRLVQFIYVKITGKNPK